jgi:hypothetical protein
MNRPFEPIDTVSTEQMKTSIVYCNITVQWKESGDGKNYEWRSPQVVFGVKIMFLLS